MIPSFSIVDVIFLPIIFLIGVITSYEDLKTGKIRNKWIVLGFIYWLIAFALFFVWNFSFDKLFEHLSSLNHTTSLIKFEYDYLFSVVINGFVTIFFVFILWEFGIIAAGDAKLFWLYSLLVPFMYYWKTYLPFFPSVVLFVNTFVIVTVYLFIISVYSYLKDNRGAYLKSFKEKMMDMKDRYEKKELQFKTVIGPLIGFLAIIVTINLIAYYYSIEINNLPAYVVIILFFFRQFLGEFFIKKNILEYIALYLLALFFYGLTIDPRLITDMLWEAVKNLTLLIIILSFIAGLIERYISATSTTTIMPENLKQKMIIDREFVNILKLDKKYFKEKIGRIYTSGLTEKQVEEIKNWAKRNDVKEIQVFKPFRLAIWIFLGVLATLIYKGSLIKLLMN